MSVQYRHLRNFNFTQFSFVAEISNLGAVTIAYIENDDNTVTFSLAICNADENFSKEYGRNLAEAKLAEGKDRYTVPAGTFTAFAFEDADPIILERHGFPKRLVLNIYRALH